LLVLTIEKELFVISCEDLSLKLVKLREVEGKRAKLFSE